MGIIVGEKISKAFIYARKNSLPVLSIISSGGRRVQEAAANPEGSVRAAAERAEGGVGPSPIAGPRHAVAEAQSRHGIAGVQPRHRERIMSFRALQRERLLSLSDPVWGPMWVGLGST